MIDLQTFFKKADLEQITKKGINNSTIEKQITQFIEGIPSINIILPATFDNTGVKRLNDNTLKHYVQIFEKIKNNLSITKFVPASGAATRMFKELFEYISSSNQEIPKNIEKIIQNIDKFAFYNQLDDILKQQNSSIKSEIENKNYKKIIELILNKKGLNYGNLPKGIIKFHKYENENRTAFEEHIAESMNYATTEKGSHIHFTVSPEHKANFQQLATKLVPKYEQKFNTKIKIDFSEQNPATDTIALTPENKPFRNNDDSILFRPAGHGALIYNLNKINADLVFVKNIDNIVPDYIKSENCQYKKAIAGILTETQKKSFELIDLLLHNPSHETMQEAFDFVQNTLCVKMYFNFEDLSKTEKIEFLIKKLDRPIRVCAMVKNEGEPGGGPFFVMQKDQTATLQIVEKAQIDLSKPEKKEIFDKSTHFNPVDIVFSPRRYNKQKFNLSNFVDAKTGFISEKSKDGKNLKALELPGLWNGAMADWNTIFVDVPILTFNPVKTISDLLRKNHQNI